MRPISTFVPSPRSAARAALILAALALATPTAAWSQAPAIPGQQPSGPVIQSTGMSIKVDNPTFAVPNNHVFRSVFEINAGGGDTVKVNEQLTTIARFYNVHVRHGYPLKNLHGAAVVHGSGWPALLTDSAFAARYGGHVNPSRRLVEELIQNGAVLVLCGQTAGARGIRREELLPGVKVAISAMTALTALQDDGYRMIPW